jgi:hypothetical protein
MFITSQGKGIGQGVHRSDDYIHTPRPRQYKNSNCTHREKVQKCSFLYKKRNIIVNPQIFTCHLVLCFCNQ